MDIKTDIIPSMILAPSAHNTQPWQFKVGENTIDVFVDWSRHLDVSDKSLRQLYVSIGCTVENGAIAAEYAGYAAEVVYFPEGEGKEKPFDTSTELSVNTTQGKPAARLTLTPSQSSRQNTALLEAIKNRRNDRAPYDGKPFTKAERTALTVLQSEHAILIQDESKKKEIAELSAKGTHKTLSTPAFKGELSKWVRSSATKQHDGMTGDAMGMPPPLALIAPFVAKNAPLHKMQTPVVKQQIATSAAVAVIATPEDTHQASMQAGRILERLWIEAVAAGLSGSVIAAAIESGEDLRQDLQDILGTQSYPQTILRLGHATSKPPKPTPRRTIKEVVLTK